MTIRWIPEAERRRNAESAREDSERHEVQWAFAHWVTQRSMPTREGQRTVRVPPLSEEMITRLRALMFEDRP